MCEDRGSDAPALGGFDGLVDAARAVFLHATSRARACGRTSWMELVDPHLWHIALGDAAYVGGVPFHRGVVHYYSE